MSTDNAVRAGEREELANGLERVAVSLEPIGMHFSARDDERSMGTVWHAVDTLKRAALALRASGPVIVDPEKFRQTSAFVCWECRTVTYTDEVWKGCDKCGAHGFVLPVVWREKPRVAAGTWEEWEQARQALFGESISAADISRLDTLHRAALARIAELEREVAARGKVIDIALNSKALIADEADRAVHRAALGERDALRRLLGFGDPLGAAYQVQLAADVLAGEVPAEAIDVRTLASHLGGLAYGIKAALRSTVPAEPPPLAAGVVALDSEQGALRNVPEPDSDGSTSTDRVWVPERCGWRLLSLPGGKCRQKKCPHPAVAELRRRNGWWKYCEQHLYGRRIRNGIIECSVHPESPMARQCVHCGHIEDDHDGYGGLCDGDTDLDARSMCGCVEYVPMSSVGHNTKDALGSTDERGQIMRGDPGADSGRSTSTAERV